MNYEESNPELESFRERWRAEVRARHPAPDSSGQQQQQQHNAVAGPSTASARVAHPTEPRGKPPPAARIPAALNYDGEDYVPMQSRSFDGPAPAGLTTLSQAGGQPSMPEKAEPVSALEHYERAVEQEAAGKLGDSLKLYRKAFRMDDRVDQKYKNKYFPKPLPKPAVAATSAGPREAVASMPKSGQPQSIADLIASFSGLGIEPAPPEVEGMPQPPCPIASLPYEILVHILKDVAVLDVGDFVRLSRVCKSFAYIVATEDAIWRRVCLGAEFGFGGMHYYWQRQITWDPLTEEDLIREAEETTAAAVSTEASADSSSIPPPELSLSARAQRHVQESAANTLALYRSLYASSWQRMFRFRPRIRFNGCYICTVNYIRSGLANVNTITWNTPVHIVTYYRYLRFFRDGTAISLQTTAEPADVVHHLTREFVASGSKVAEHSILKGRWRLAREADNPGAPASEVEGDVMIETEGVAKYIYRLDLAMRSAGRGAKNNKLVWKGFYNYNTLTEDWAEFTLRDNTPFFFSRVKSYGVRGQ